MTSVRLRKPLYEWADDDEIYYPYRLSDEVSEWMSRQNISYSLRTEQEPKDQYTYLICYIEIEDPRQAMLFKLTWI